ncbi:MAG: D-alanyl-D-alanine carboxypeptidase family protein, partial [Gammaproteobacteria bacterium]
ASLTKIMTVYVVFRELKNGNLTLDETTRISEKAWRTPGSRMFVEVNRRVSIEDLLKGVIIQSGNDATVALAEHVAGDESTFAALMNQHAARLGMLNTHFTDSNGLPSPEHFSSARDMAILTAALIREFPDFYRWFSEKEFTYNNITQPNRNRLLWRDESVDGVKTGYTEDAGYCLVASAKREEMRLISVVMGTSSANARAKENQSLLNYGFRFFETHRLYKANDALTEAKIWKGETGTLSLGLNDDLYVTVPRRHYDDLKAVLTVDDTIMAPVKKGQSFGTVSISLGDDTIINRPLVALTSVEEGGIFQQLYDEAMLRFK